MKTLLCYGDSNTWGYVPLKKTRYDTKTRWPMALMRILNGGSPESPLSYEDPQWWVVEEGMNARTTSREDPIEGDLNGMRHLYPTLLSHKPLDLVIIMLGTNDLKVRFSPIPEDIARGAQKLAIAAQNPLFGPNETPAKALLICPPPLVDSPNRNPIFGDATALSRKLAPLYRQYAEEAGAAFLDAGEFIQTSTLDGIHLERESHLKLALALAGVIRGM
jgi:lysophospholipase L1-like esterase